MAGLFKRLFSFGGIGTSPRPRYGCTHLGEIRDVAPLSEGCDECIKAGDKWVHLRVCLICGKVGCCDYSKNKHATLHFRETGHPLIASLQPGEDWIWCYVDQKKIDRKVAV